MKHEEFKGIENMGSESISPHSKETFLLGRKSFRFKDFHISNFHETLNSVHMYISERKKTCSHGTNYNEILLNVIEDGLHRNAKEMEHGFKYFYNLY